MFSTQGAKILDGTPNYLVLEDIGEIDSLKHFGTTGSLLLLSMIFN